MSSAKAIADALAARFVGITATNGTVTEPLAAAPTASLPNTVAKGPVVLVFHPQGVLDIGVSKLRRDELDFPVRLLRDPVDYPTRSDWLYAWYDATRDRVEMDMDLGLSYVAWARPISASVELDGHEYAGTTYDVIEFVVRVHLNEVVSTLAP